MAQVKARGVRKAPSEVAHAYKKKRKVREKASFKSSL